LNSAGPDLHPAGQFLLSFIYRDCLKLLPGVLVLVQFLAGFILLGQQDQHLSRRSGTRWWLQADLQILFWAEILRLR